MSRAFCADRNVPRYLKAVGSIPTAPTKILLNPLGLLLLLLEFSPRK
jgi:hypothetical protein